VVSSSDVKLTLEESASLLGCSAAGAGSGQERRTHSAVVDRPHRV